MTDDDALVGPSDAPDLHCMTLNVRRPVPHLRRDHPDAWGHRHDALARLVRTESPHLLAVQEAVADQVTHVSEALGPRWEPVVVGRGRDGGGEHVGFFVDRDRLAVRARWSGALSRRPDHPGSRSWGALFPRVLVGVELGDRATGIRFLALATHLDPFSPVALRRGAEQVARVAADTDLPVVAMADWNSGARSAVASTLAAAALVDTWDAAEQHLTPAFGTYPHYRSPRRGGARLDRVLARGARVRAAAISTRRPGGVWPSDHAAVHAVIRWEAR